MKYYLHRSNRLFTVLATVFCMLCAGTAWGADISHYATGLENGTTGMKKGDCSSIDESTDAPRTGAKCLSTAYSGSGNKKWYPDVTFAVPKNSYFHVIGYAKLASTDATAASTSTQAYADAYVGGAKAGTAVNLTTSWQRITATSGKAGSDKTGALAYFYRKHASSRVVLFDDIVAYVSTNSSVDLTAPSSATSASATETEITWTCGSDANTGIQATQIWKRISGDAEDLTLNNQGIYAMAATEGPKVDQSGHWQLVAASLAADATSYSGTFGSKEKYAIVHRDLAYNYSAPTYVTTPDNSIKTLYLKPGTNWLKKGGSISPRFAVYCYGDGDEWFSMEEVDAGCGSGTIYKAVVKAKYPNCIFCRMNGSTTDNNWGNKWNQTGNLNMPTTEAGVYEVPNDAWDGSDNSKWRTTPLNLCISGSWLCFVGEELTLTANSIGATSYQWYKGGTAEANKIPGATTATYINHNFAYEDAGDYYCKSRLGDGTELTSAKLTVKTLRIYFNNGRGGGAYGYVNLSNTDPDHKKATGLFFLGQNWKYAFCVADGVGHYYGQNNADNESGWMKISNCTGWKMDVDGTQCLMKTENGAHYTFIVDYSDITKPIISVIYPPDNQAAGQMIYFDNSLINWSEPLYYRVGRGKRGSGDYTQANLIDKVPGTANLYQYQTPKFDDLDAWHIADNCGHQGYSYSIYLTDTDDSYVITKSISFEGGATSQDITVEPTGSHQYGRDSEYPDPVNDDCDFYSWNMLLGMKKQNVMVDGTEHGSITVSYVDVDGNPQSFNSGDRDLAHTCILTITTTPDCGYQLASLTVNGAPFASGNTYILDSRTVIDAEFEIATYSVTLHTNGGLILMGDVTDYTYGIGATLPTYMSLTGKDFAGWYDNAGLTGTPVTEIAPTECGDKEFWAKWENETTKVTYIIGACQVTGGEWIQGENGTYSAWLFQAGVTPAENSLMATSDIKIPSLNTTDQWFLTKDVTTLSTNSNWSHEDNTTTQANKSIRAFKVGSGSTVEFDLKAMEASGISFYVFPSSNDDYSVDLKVNGTTEKKDISGGEQYQVHRFDYFGDTYMGKFSIKSNNKESRVVVVVEVPNVTIQFDKNASDATGTMENLVAPKGSERELPKNDFTRSGCVFKYWTTDAPGAGTPIADKSKYTVSDNVTLYAQWEHETVITLDGNGATNHYTTSVTAILNHVMPEIAVLPIKPGYVFQGYFDGVGGTGTQYYSATGESVRNWDKDVATYTLYAKWLTPCETPPTLTNVSSIVTIWDQHPVDISLVKLSCLFDTIGVLHYTLLSVSPTDPIPGCEFKYFDDYIHIMGTPTLYNSSVETVDVTFTITNDCDPATTATITQTIQIYPKNQKARIAFIVRGTEGGAFNACTAGDMDDCETLVTYLRLSYTVDFVNGYASKDPSILAAYYDDYDLLVVTDFLDTGKGYTNAIGTLIDKKPILSFEAYVANQSNWHIGSNPKDPKPKVQDMKVLCAGHAIFKDDNYYGTPVDVVNTDTIVHVLSSLSTADDAKGLQGFVINEAPDFIFLATVKDANNKRDLIVCCERQVVFPARLMLFGINFYEMSNLSPAGQIIIRQMIDYLLMTDETKIADCSLVFDNGRDNTGYDEAAYHAAGGTGTKGDGLWSTAANWAPGYNIIPTPYHPTRIIAECHVDYDAAHAGSVKVNKGRDDHGNVVDGKLIIESTGGLTVAGMVAKVNDTRYASPTTIKAEDLYIKADAGNNGAFVYGNKESDVRATVEYYCLGKDAISTPIWQYMGIPFQANQTAIKMYYAAWMCRWTTATTDELGGLWQWVENEDVLLPFEGYCITQAEGNAHTYVNAGKLNAPVTTVLNLNNRGADGFAFASNSWTAPIKIQEMKDEDFYHAEKSIYIYHTGSYDNWEANGEAVSAVAPGAAAHLPGQYAVVPIHSSPYLEHADSVIPAMQGFFVKTTDADATLSLVYNRVVYDASYFKTSTQPMRSPRRGAAKPDVMRLMVYGATSGGDQVHLLALDDFSDAYEDGWDGRKIDGDAAAPKLAVIKQAGEMSVAAIEEFEGRMLSFRAGNDIDYTFTFNYAGDEIYLYDRVTEQATLITTGNTYSFTAANKTDENRFLITANPPRTPTDIVTVNGERLEENGAQKFIKEGKLLIFYRGVIYNALGAPIQNRKEGAQ